MWPQVFPFPKIVSRVPRKLILQNEEVVPAIVHAVALGAALGAVLVAVLSPVPAAVLAAVLVRVLAAVPAAVPALAAAIIVVVGIPTDYERKSLGHHPLITRKWEAVRTQISPRIVSVETGERKMQGLVDERRTPTFQKQLHHPTNNYLRIVFGLPNFCPSQLNKL